MACLGACLRWLLCSSRVCSQNVHDDRNCHMVVSLRHRVSKLPPVDSARYLAILFCGQNFGISLHFTRLVRLQFQSSAPHIRPTPDMP